MTISDLHQRVLITVNSKTDFLLKIKRQFYFELKKDIVPINHGCCRPHAILTHSIICPHFNI